MTSWTAITFCITLASIGSLLFSTLTYALRDFSRVTLGEQLERVGKSSWLQITLDNANELIVVTALCRLVMNLSVFVGVLHIFHESTIHYGYQYLLAMMVTAIITLLTSVTIPHAIAREAGERWISVCVRFLHLLRVVFQPVIRLMHATDHIVESLAGESEAQQPEKMVQQIENEILSVVQEGVEEGVVDKTEREMIKSVIEFRDTHVAQTMTARPEIVGLSLKATLVEIKQTIEESGHSRLPVFDGTVDHIVGILYARDLINYVGLSISNFDIRSCIRPAFYVPEQKPLRELLIEFRVRKIHMAIVLDEYGGTAGLVTIEDVLEELVGEISDEHEPIEPAMFKRLSDKLAEADARIYLDQLNRLLELALPEDAGYDTLGGFVTTTLGQIPAAGTTFDHAGARFTVVAAGPTKVDRVRIELLPEVVETPVGK